MLKWVKVYYISCYLPAYYIYSNTCLGIVFVFYRQKIYSKEYKSFLTYVAMYKSSVQSKIKDVA